MNFIFTSKHKKLYKYVQYLPLACGNSSLSSVVAFSAAPMSLQALKMRLL